MAHQLGSRIAGSGAWVNILGKRILATIVFVLMLSLSPAMQQASDVQVLMQDSHVRSALAAAKASEPRTLEDQIRFCEVPAPPFKEAARAEVLRREFVQLGLQNVRLDRAGNVLGDRPGDSPRPHLVLAAHL